MGVMMNMMPVAMVLAAMLSLSVGTSYEFIPAQEQNNAAKVNLDDTTPPSTGPFREWLNALVIRLPNSTIPVNNSGITGTIGINDLLCENITLAEMDSSRTKSTPSLSLNLTGVTVACETIINVDLDVPIIKNVKTSISTYIYVNPATMNYTLELPVGNNGLPESAKCTNVVLNALISKLHLEFEKSFIFREQIESFLENQIKKAVPELLDNVVAPLIRNLTDTNLTAVLRDLNVTLGPKLDPAPIPPPAPAVPGAANLLDSEILTVLNDLVSKILGPGGKFSLNTIIDILTHNTGDLNITIPDAQVSIPVPGFNASIDLGFESIFLGGLDTFESFEVLEAVGPVSMVSHTNMTDFVASITITLNLTTDDGPVSSVPLFEELTVDLNLGNPNLYAMTELALNESRLQQEGMGLIKDPDCILTAVLDLQTSFLEFEMKSEALEVLPGSGNLEVDIDKAVNNIVGLAFDSYSVAIPSILNTLLADPLIELANNFTKKEIDHATCDNSSNPSPSFPNNLLPPDTPDTYITADISIFVSAGIITIAFALLTYKLEKKNTSPFNKASQKNIYEGVAKQLRSSINDAVEDSDISPDVPLFLDPRIGFLPRVLVMAGIIITCAMFAASNDSIGAKVYLTLTLGEESYRPSSLFNFGLVDTVKQMWLADVQFLSIIVCLFSGAWPYLKVVLMAVCWITPASRLSIPRRESLMMFLDALGKWSLIDSFLMTLFLVAFEFDLGGNVPGHTPGTEVFAGVNVQVLPCFGFHGFILATVMSLIMSHVILAYHRRVNDPPLSKALLQGDQKQSVSSHTYIRKGKRMVFSTAGKLFVTILLVAAVGLVGAGVFYTSFGFVFKGAAGAILGSKNVRNYSVVTLAEALATSASYAGPLALRMIQALFLGFSIIFPLGQLVVMLSLWIIPLRLKVQTRLFHAAEVLNAWAALDVFVFAIIASILEISKFAQFIVGSKCAPLNGILHKFDKVLHGDDKCFDLTTSLGAGCWLLFGAAVVQTFIGGAVLKLCHTAIKQREFQYRKTTSNNYEDGESTGEKPDCCTSIFVYVPFMMVDEGAPIA